MTSAAKLFSPPMRILDDMNIRCLGFVLTCATGLLIAAGHADAQSLSAPLPLLASEPHMQGLVDSSWSKAVKLPVLFDFTYQRAGEPATVYAAQDANGLDFAFDVTQKEPLTASQHADGPGVLNDDFVEVQLWPQGVQGFGYTFAANPAGARYQTSSENSAYSPQWIAVGTRTVQGYVVTMHIPFDIMRSGGSHNWSAQFTRMIVATNSMDVWEHVAGQRNSSDPTYAGVLTGVAATSQAKASRPQPRLQLYALGEAATPGYGGDTSRVGADVSIPVTSTSSFIGTFHPDYSNVEVDQQTISPTAFARRYNEVRPFFTQAGSFFNYHFECTNCPQTLYTPSIPAFRDGYAYEGTRGNLTYAAFDALGDQRTDGAQTATYSYSSPGTVFQVTGQRVAVNMPGFNDDTWTIDSGVTNNHTHLMLFLNAGGDSGTNVTDYKSAQYYEYGAGYAAKTTTAILDLQKVGPQFQPYDGYVMQPGIAGYIAFLNKTLNFSATRTLHDVVFTAVDQRSNDPSGRPANISSELSAELDFKDELSLTLSNGTQGVETAYSGEFLPFAGSGFELSYKGQTATPTSVNYSAGPYFHGHLTSWSYLTTLPIVRRVNLSLEADENLYSGSNIATEPRTEQWLERVGIDWQFSRDASFDVGARRIIGRNLPNAFQAPDLPDPVFNGSLPFDDVNAGNVSAAFHFLAAKNEFYVVYGDPNQLTTTPALFIKWIRYIGAEKGV